MKNILLCIVVSIEFINFAHAGEIEVRNENINIANKPKLALSREGRRLELILPPQGTSLPEQGTTGLNDVYTDILVYPRDYQIKQGDSCKNLDIKTTGTSSHKITLRAEGNDPQKVLHCTVEKLPDKVFLLPLKKN